MGRYTFRLPDIGEGIAEAEIVAWHVKIGDRVEEDGRLADMMTDKATVEMESPVAGIVRELAGEVGDTVPIGSALAVIETEGDEGEQVEERIAAETPDAGDVDRALAPVTPVRHMAKPDSGKVLASPVVRARARELGIDLAMVPADGIVRHVDLDRFLASRMQSTPVAESALPAEQLSGAAEQIKLVGLRRRIAENMAASKRHIPHFSYVEECDVTALEALRADLNELRGDRPKLTVLPLLIAAICRSLLDYPMINARFDDLAGVVTRYASAHMGVAVQTPGGLMVPVIQDAQSKSLWELAAEISRLAQAARDGSARSEELSGSTLTVTSLGPLGGIATTPVINRPEVAIIGPNRIVERPVFVGDHIERRKLMNLSISCDHRVVDGWDAANFVQAVKRLLELPLILLAD
ncbi:MAG TPA: dihydrolipoamide acetyltransferase family protein [Novosphingobium sp.]